MRVFVALGNIQFTLVSVQLVQILMKVDERSRYML
jgi:hypothetical protein